MAKIDCMGFNVDIHISGGSRISRKRGINLKGGGANLLFCPIFPKKLHENKKIGPRGRVSLAPPLGGAIAYGAIATMTLMHRSQSECDGVLFFNFLCAILGICLHCAIISGYSTLS